MAPEVAGSSPVGRPKRNYSTFRSRKSTAWTILLDNLSRILYSGNRNLIATKIRIDIDEDLAEPEIAIRGGTDDIAKLQAAILNAVKRQQKLQLLRDDRDYFVPATNVLFFESVDGKTWAHTAKNIYEIRARLYELEQILPPFFSRISKSSLANTREIWSIRKNLAGPSIVKFRGSEKQVSLSRSFYKSLTERLNANNFN